MRKEIVALCMVFFMVFTLNGCSGNGAGDTSVDTSTSESDSSETSENDTASEEASQGNESGQTAKIGTVSNSIAEDKEALIESCADKFEQKTYKDADSGLSITYNLYLPEGYDKSSSYPMVVFIGDSSCTGDDPTVSLTQGRGGLVWVTDEWQAANPSIVAVPVYPEIILDDHGSYTTTEYVELTKRFIDYMGGEYAVDQNRIYGTGQSMGCMTTLILASKYPDLYAACMFVDGQWDINEIKGLKDQTFVYFAAEDDTNAWNGAQEVMSMLDDEKVSYEYAQWDGNWSVDELSEASKKLFKDDEKKYFISWKTGTITPVSMGGAANGGAGFGGPGGGADSENASDDSEKPKGNFPGPGNGEDSSGEGQGASGGMDSASYHMASFDYAYNCVAVMEWVFQQSK